jgi:hypothetical protein
MKSKKYRQNSQRMPRPSNLLATTGEILVFYASWEALITA